MAIQIKELIIKAVCGEKNPANSGSTPNQSENSDSSIKLSYTQRKQIIDECTREVLERLKRMDEF